MNRKASRLFKSFQALPQDPAESRAELDRPEADPAQSAPGPEAKPELTLPPEDAALAPPLRHWGINE